MINYERFYWLTASTVCNILGVENRVKDVRIIVIFSFLIVNLLCQDASITFNYFSGGDYDTKMLVAHLVYLRVVSGILSRLLFSCRLDLSTRVLLAVVRSIAR